MESIFDIFNSHEHVKLPDANPHLHSTHPFKTVLPSEECMLPGKQLNRNAGPSTQGKKVLGDVGNKLKGNKTREFSSQESAKKVFQEKSFVSNSSGKMNSVEKSTTKDCDVSLKNPNNLPDTEWQGSPFWMNDDNHSNLMDEYPSIEDICKTSKIWDINTRPIEEHSSSSLLSDDSYENIDLCLDLPALDINDIPNLEEVSVKFPWQF